MTLPSPLPLGDFERAIQTDPEVLGVFYFGSLGQQPRLGLDNHYRISYRMAL